jgi:hypothetical protein
MRHIDHNQVQNKINADWQQRAGQALQDVQGSAADERSARVNAHADVWQDADLKAILLGASYDKCWYCESRQVRSDKAVDHFRPKNRVAECPDHPGYWWMAFDLMNYRLSCTYCNSRRRDRANQTTGGKQDCFPLIDETHRAYEGNVTAERPKLLDPLTFTDPGLLWFQPDGEAVSKYSEDTHPVYYLRSTCSIDLYHLNHTDLKEKRQELCNFIERRVKEGDMFFARASTGDDTASHAWEGVLHDLNDFISLNAEYSASARAMIKILTSEHPWVDAVL